MQELTDEGTGRQDMVEAMDQLGSHVSPSEVGSSNHSTHSGTRSEACAAAELEAVQQLALGLESETSSERIEQQAREADYIGSPETVQGDNGEEGEYMGEEVSNEENEEESEASQAAEVKGAKPSGDGLERRGVDG